MLQVGPKMLMSSKPRGQRKETKSELVYQDLRRQILSSALPPGATVSERLLAERLEVGKAPVRVAIQRLAGEGFVDIEPRRGIRITEQSVQDILDLFQVRVLMEQLTVRKIAGHLSPQQLARLQDNQHEMREASLVPDLDKIIQADFAFHRMLAEFHGNKQIALMLERILDSLYREVRNSMQVRHRAEESLVEHQRVMDALKCKDPVAAEQAIANHLQRGHQFVMSRNEARPKSVG